MTLTIDESLTCTDFFCGMGGSSTGLSEAGFDVKVAANHWDRAIETHSANHPDTEHLCADLQAIDLRYLPRTRMLWASPICTEVSPAGGRKKRTAAGSLFEEHGHVAAAAFDRTRVTFWEVIRATEIHRYEVVAIENVVEAAAWELFDVWLAGMAALGYAAQFVSVSAAHVGDDINPHAPQWRDRIYIIFTRKGIPKPDLEPRPLAWCGKCGEDVSACQWWKKPGRRIGKYRQQYIYVCPVGNHGQVEPYVAPAAAAIDWTDLGVRIGDRAELGMRALAAKTMRRIEMGLEMVSDPVLVAAAGNGEALVSVEPYITMLRANNRPTGMSEPLSTFSTGRNHGLTVPPGAMLMSPASGGKAKPVTEPTPALVTTTRPMLVIPYRRGAKPHPTSQPLSTQATRESHGLMSGINIDDCRFRMLHPRESANAQRFPRSYVIHGNRGEQQMQAGNAVAVNVSHWIGRQVARALGSAA